MVQHPENTGISHDWKLRVVSLVCYVYIGQSAKQQPFHYALQMRKECLISPCAVYPPQALDPVAGYDPVGLFDFLFRRQLPGVKRQEERRPVGVAKSDSLCILRPKPGPDHRVISFSWNVMSDIDFK